MKRLVKSQNKTIFGVLGGIAEYFNLDPTVIRIAYVALSVFSVGFPGLFLYIIMALIIPNE